jgi:hypothetical protein
MSLVELLIASATNGIIEAVKFFVSFPHQPSISHIWLKPYSYFPLYLSKLHPSSPVEQITCNHNGSIHIHYRYYFSKKT